MNSTRMRVCAGASVVMLVAASACGQASHMNALGNYGRLDQKNLTMFNANPNFGRWSCGPTSLANSLTYLERQFPGHYNRTLIPEMSVPANATIENEEILDVAEQLASPVYVNQSKGVPPPMRVPPPPPGQDYEYDREYDSNTPDSGPGGSGGVTYERFFFGKDCWFARPGVPFTRLYGEKRRIWDGAEGGVPNAVPKPGWVRDAVTLNTELMFQHLRENSDVELGFSWAQFNQAGNLQLTGGGHLVTVYGYDFTYTDPSDGREYDGDLNGNGKFDPGDSATLKIIDPWAPVPAAIGNVAPAIDAIIFSQIVGNTERLLISYGGGAAGAAGLGLVEAWASEVPAPGAGTVLAAGLWVLARRRRLN